LKAGDRQDVLAYAGRIFTSDMTEERMFELLQERNVEMSEELLSDADLLRMVQHAFKKWEPMETARKVTIGANSECQELQAPDGFNMTELGNAERLDKEHGEDILWVSGSTINSAGNFFYWDGQRWCEGRGAQIVELAKQSARNL